MQMLPAQNRLTSGAIVAVARGNEQASLIYKLYNAAFESVCYLVQHSLRVTVVTAGQGRQFLTPRESPRTSLLRGDYQWE
jgi:hypothetical protein